ncbi:hypothetical protein F2P81_019152 [Scophthalmus maximus]|uniref:Uncharacterized protein n=1 Tax=Scophthalmus maximus TaxID=52904 RepID=A0A6A4S710_SCOMX|nr:hypothetical protein F2P81_019152 [Scophthalmus maximus]
MLLRSAASALLRTSTVTPPLRPASTVRFVRQSLRYPPQNRPFSTSVCLRQKKKKERSLWLQLAEGQTMDGNIEEILAPLRLAVKEQVAPASPALSSRHEPSSVRYERVASVACRPLANRLTRRLLHKAVNE